jgi:hypothetical protein
MNLTDFQRPKTVTAVEVDPWTGKRRVVVREAQGGESSGASGGGASGDPAGPGEGPGSSVGDPTGPSASEAVGLGNFGALGPSDVDTAEFEGRMGVSPTRSQSTFDVGSAIARSLGPLTRGLSMFEPAVGMFSPVLDILGIAFDPTLSTEQQNERAGRMAANIMSGGLVGLGDLAGRGLHGVATALGAEDPGMQAGTFGGPGRTGGGATPGQSGGERTGRTGGATALNLTEVAQPEDIVQDPVLGPLAMESLQRTRQRRPWTWDQDDEDRDALRWAGV